MKIIIHRGTHQIGGVATEICTKRARLLFDMGDELSLEPDFVSAPLEIDGVTNEKGDCDGVLFTHYHGDHVGQMMSVREDIPLYIGGLAKDIMQKSTERKICVDKALCQRIEKMRTFEGGVPMEFGDVRVTPYSIDHSAPDSYLFLIEAEGKRVLLTGDFRMHGFRGGAMVKILNKIGKVDVVITEGTTLSRGAGKPVTERELQQRVREYMAKYKYAFVLCSTTSLERICALSKAVPQGKYFVCDGYQRELIELLEKHWHSYSSLYDCIKKTTYGDNLLPKLRQRGFLMLVRDNKEFREIIKKFDRSQSIILYSMWDGYRTRQGSTIPDFLQLAGTWETLHTSGHATKDGIRTLLSILKPTTVIPMHTDFPEAIKDICSDGALRLARDGEEIII